MNDGIEILYLEQGYLNRSAIDQALYINLHIWAFIPDLISISIIQMIETEYIDINYIAWFQSMSQCIYTILYNFKELNIFKDQFFRHFEKKHLSE